MEGNVYNCYYIILFWIKHLFYGIRSGSIFEFDDCAKPKSKDDEAYHFVAIVPIEGRLYELDGLKEGPIDLGSIKPNTDWVDVAKPFIEKRINK